MATIRRRREWKPDHNGRYSRILGWKEAIGCRFVRHKFYLGTDEKAARERAGKLESMWAKVEERAKQFGKPPCWDREAMKIAKAVAHGDTVFPVPQQKYGNQDLYLRHIYELANRFPVIQYVPEDGAWFATGVAGVEQKISQAQQKIDEHRALLEKVGVRPRPVAGGPTLHEALEIYKDYIRHDPKMIDPKNGRLTAWGYKRVQTLDMLKERHEDRPLAILDLEGCEEIVRYWRGRPAVKKRGNTMSVKTCKKNIQEFARFCNWLHRSKQFPWRKPEDLDLIDRRVHVTADEVAKLLDSEQVDTFDTEELKKILPTTSGISRAMLLLGLNCGFGAGECGTLTLGEVYLYQAHPKAAKIGWQENGKDSFIRRIRRKNKVYGEFLLWPETVESLRWLIERRQRLGNATKDGLLFVAENGEPMYKLTEGGNSGQQFPNMWYRIIAGVPGVRKLSFGKLRKTAGDLIRTVAGGEVSGVFLCHGKPVKTDELADVYTNRPWAKVFQAQQQVRERLQPVFGE
jgi:hypothetical protein